MKRQQGLPTLTPIISRTISLVIPFKVLLVAIKLKYTFSKGFGFSILKHK